MEQHFVFERRLNKVDALYCFLDKLRYANTGMCLVAVLAGEVDPRVIQDAVERGVEEVPRFRDHLRYLPGDVGPPLWIHEPHLDVTGCVEERDLGVNGSWAELMSIVDTSHSTKFPANAPPWRVTYVRGLPDGRAAVVLALHHALSDATALTAMISSVLIRDTLAAAGITVRCSATPNEERSFRDPLLHWRRVWHDARQSALAAAHAAGPRSLLKRELRIALEYLPRRNTWTAARHSARRRSFLFRVPLPAWKDAATSRGGNINDLYLAFATAALRRYLVLCEAGKGREGALRVVMPVNVRDPEGPQDGGNVTGNGILSLHGTSEQLDDLDAVAGAARRARNEATETGSAVVEDLVAMLPGRAQAAATFRRFSQTDIMATNMVIPFSGSIAGVPGEMMFMVPPVIGPPVSYALASYADWLHIAVTVDCGLVDAPERLGTVVREQLAELLGDACVEPIGL